MQMRDVVFLVSSSKELYRHRRPKHTQTYFHSMSERPLIVCIAFWFANLLQQQEGLFSIVSLE